MSIILVDISCDQGLSFFQFLPGPVLLLAWRAGFLFVADFSVAPEPRARDQVFGVFFVSFASLESITWRGCCGEETDYRGPEGTTGLRSAEAW